MANKKRNAVRHDAPAGYVKVETTLAGFWKPEGEGEYLEGIVGAAIETTGADGKPNTFYPVQLTTDEGATIVSKHNGGKAIKPTVGNVVGVGGKMLALFMNDHVGREVFIVYRGLGKAKPGQSAPKMYDTYAKPAAE